MKKLLGVISIGCLMFTGCATDGAYNTAKSGVKIVKKGVELTDTKVSNNVKNAYEIAKDYDTLRNEVRKKSVTTQSVETE